MDYEELRKVINDHEAWLRSSGSSKGKRADLSGADLRYANFGRVNLDKADLTGADFRNACLARASLHKAHLDKALMRGCHLIKSNLRERQH